MKRFLKWFAITVGVLGVAGFLAFLYFIPPLTTIPPEEFSRPVGEAGPALDAISDPATRLMAERGKYLVTIGACADCHSTPSAQGPRYADMYLAGGFKATRKGYGTYISMNITPDKETGIGNFTDEQTKRILKSGVAPDGRAIPGHLMPWPAYSNWTDEDLHAVVVYLRHLKPVTHRIPPPAPAGALTDPAAYEEGYAGSDYAAQGTNPAP